VVTFSFGFAPDNLCSRVQDEPMNPKTIGRNRNIAYMKQEKTGVFRSSRIRSVGFLNRRSGVRVSPGAPAFQALSGVSTLARGVVCTLAAGYPQARTSSGMSECGVGL
jgi:hypothetical protein